MNDDAGLAKKRIRQKALQLFSQHGYKKVTVRDLMDSCGLSPGALYAHYATKEDVLFDLLQLGHAELRRDLEAAEKSSPDPISRFTRLVYVHALNAMNYPELARLADSDIRLLPEAAQTRVRDTREELNKFFLNTLEEGIYSDVFAAAYLKPTLLAIIASSNQLPHWFNPEGKITKWEMAKIHALLALRSICKGLSDKAVTNLASAALEGDWAAEWIEDREAMRNTSSRRRRPLAVTRKVGRAKRK